MSNPDPTAPSLKRTFGLVTLVAFGIGDILGAGIYGLIGNVAREVGSAVWAAFLVSFVVAAFTGLSYAELGSRLPHSGGEARYAENAFRRKWLAYVVGFLVLLSGLVSISTVSHIFANYLTVEGGLLPGLPGWIIRLVFLLGIGVITYWGIRQSSATNVICTLVEMGGLLVVVVVALPSFGSVDYFEFPAAEGGGPFEGVPVWALLSGGVLAFYSFIGFEDLANVAEEVKNPRRNLPRAIVIALAIAAVFYGLVSIAAVSVIPHQELASSGSSAPLLEVVKQAAPGFPIRLFSVIALFAVTNTALVNFVMGSRLLYGMARQQLVPEALGRVHPGRSTPHVSILLILVVTGILTLTLEKATLAGTTSFILLAVFFVVNISLAVMKLRKDEVEEGVVKVPLFVPFVGAALTVALALATKPKALISFAILAPAGLLLYLLVRPVRRRRAR
ncbi:MAG: APC family permease [Planctomycetota bacterium]